MNMAYIQPTLLSMNSGAEFPINMPKSGGSAVINPGDDFWTFYFDDGREAYYDFNGKLKEGFTPSWAL